MTFVNTINANTEVSFYFELQGWNMLTIKVLPASNGDSFLISIGKEKKSNILIDGGTGAQCYSKIYEVIETLKKKKEAIDLLIITHIDDDHISGIINIFEDDSIDKSIIKEVWFNSGEMISSYFKTTHPNNRFIDLTIEQTKVSVSQGVTLESEMKRHGFWNENLICSDIDSNNKYCRFGAEIEILSPGLKELEKLNKKWEVEQNKEVKVSAKNDYSYSLKELLSNKFKSDRSVANGSSIAFLLKINNYSLLMLGDSHPAVIIKALKKKGITTKNKLKVNFMKVSHHGSKKNTSNKILELIDCQDFIISTDGSNHGLPHKECLARVISSCENPNLYFNYEHNRIFSEEDKKEFSFNVINLENNDYEIFVREDKL